MPELPTRCMHGPRCQAMRAEHERFECATFVPNGLAAKRARHLVSLVIAAWDLPELEDAAVEVASELTTNALRFGRLIVRVDLRVYIETGQFVFEVEDHSPHRPSPKPLAAARKSGSGFGLQIVSDTADDWGFEYYTTDHKRVWAAWDLPARPTEPAEDTRHRSSGMTNTDAPTAIYPGDRRAWTLAGDPSHSPTLGDVRAWCRGTVTGAWGLPIDSARAVDHALTGMMPEKISPDEPVTVRLVRVLSGHASILTVIVDDEMVQLPPVEPSCRVPAAR